jgi:hypothetical protein
MCELEKLVCPSPEIIDWVANSMREEQKENIDSRDLILKSINTQIDRLDRMDNDLYDDKLAGDIGKEKYDQKHAHFMAQKAAMELKSQSR